MTKDIDPTELSTTELEWRESAHRTDDHRDESERRGERAEQLRTLTHRVTDGANARDERSALIAYLATHGWTQVELAERAEISQQAVSKILKSTAGQRNITTPEAQSQWYLIGRVLGIGDMLADDLGARANPGKDLYRLTEKYFAQPINAELLGRIRKLIDAGIENLAKQPRYRALVNASRAALAEIDEYLTVPTAIIRPGVTGGEQFILGFHHQRSALKR